MSVTHIIYFFHAHSACQHIPMASTMWAAWRSTCCIGWLCRCSPSICCSVGYAQTCPVQHICLILRQLFTFAWVREYILLDGWSTFIPLNHPAGIVIDTFSIIKDEREDHIRRTHEICSIWYTHACRWVLSDVHTLGAAPVSILSFPP